MWLRKMGEKMGQNWDEILIFHSPISPIFPEVEDLPHTSLCKNQLTALTDEKKNGNVCHSPTRTATAAGADAWLSDGSPLDGRLTGQPMALTGEPSGPSSSVQPPPVLRPLTRHAPSVKCSRARFVGCCATGRMMRPGLSFRGKKGGARNANRNKRSLGCSLLHVQDMGKTQNHRNSIEQRLAVGGGWRLAAVGGWWSLEGCL